MNSTNSRSNIEDECQRLREASRQVASLLEAAGSKLSAMLNDEFFMEATPLEVAAEMESAAGAMDTALRLLRSAAPGIPVSSTPVPGGPTYQQGQFLAFIREYMLRNHAGVAPTHAALQRFFNLTAPSVNSMLVRLEKRGFIRRIPQTARAIELTIAPHLIPPLERQFKV